MEKQITAGELIAMFAARTRVLVLGGVAVIAHGMSRNTHDADVWVEPGENAVSWANLVLAVIAGFPTITPVRLALWTPLAAAELADAIESDGINTFSQTNDRSSAGRMGFPA